MIRDNRLIIKNSGILFFRLLFTSLIGLFTSRIIIQSLGVSDFGLYSVVGGLVVMMAFLNTVMTSTTYRFIAFEMGKGNNDGVNQVFNISLVVHLCLALLVLLLTETVGVYYVHNYLNLEAGKLTDALFVLRFSMVATVISIVSIPYQGLVTAQENFTVQASIEIIRSILGFFVALTIFYYTTGSRIRLYAMLIAIVNIVPAFLFFAYCKRKHGEFVKWNFQRRKNKYKEMIGYTGWLMFGTAAWVGQRQGSDLIVNAFFGTVLNAAMGIANQVNSIILMFARNLAQAAIPQITKSVSGENTERTKTLVAYISKYTCFLMLLPALPILLETNYLLSLWLGNLPPYTTTFCQLIIINALIESLSSGVPAVVMAAGKVKYFMIIGGIISLISLPIAYLFFKLGYPPYAILIIYILTTGTNVIASQVLLKKIIDFNISYFLKTAYLRILYVSAMVAPLFLIHGLFPEGFSRFIFFSSFAVVWLLLAIYFFGIDKTEKDTLTQVAHNFIKARPII
jgi:O-antigen/teichoic acid export membrane protein